MAPRKKYRSTVIVFDVNSKPAFKEEALKCYLQICGNGYFSENLDCSQLILMNTVETSNKKNDKEADKYLNIVEATGMVVYNLGNVIHVEEAEPAPGNWIEGVHVAVEELLTSSDSTTFDTYQLIVISDLTTPLNMDRKEIDAVVKSIKKQLCQIDGYIYFLGLNVSVPNMLCSKTDVYKWTENLNTAEMNDNYKIAACILEECYGVMCDLTVGVDLIESYKYSKRGYPFIEPLKFRELEIFTACVRYLNCKPLLNPRRDTDGFLEKTFVYAEDQSQEVDQSNTIRGLALQNKLVIIPADVDKGIKGYDRFFKLLGFTDASNVPDDYMLASNTNLMTAYEGRDPEIQAVNYIIKACHKFNKYGIALRAYMKNSRPRLYCLIPKIDPTCFVAVELPYAEDVNILYGTDDCEKITFKEDSYVDYENVLELKDNIYAYLDGISMEDKVKLHPYIRENCGKRKTIDFLVNKVKGEELKQLDLPLGDLQVAGSDDLCESINLNWFSKGDLVKI